MFLNQLDLNTNLILLCLNGKKFTFNLNDYDIQMEIKFIISDFHLIID